MFDVFVFVRFKELTVIKDKSNRKWRKILDVSNHLQHYLEQKLLYCSFNSEKNVRQVKSKSIFFLEKVLITLNFLTLMTLFTLFYRKKNLNETSTLI